MERTSFNAGGLGGRVAIKCAICYAILQTMFISGCIATEYRLMVYHIEFVNIDLSKIAPLAQIWSIFLEITQYAPADLRNSTMAPVDISSKLDELLHTYKESNTPAIRVYKVSVTTILDSRISLLPSPYKTSWPARLPLKAPLGGPP